ncbi:MAG: glutathione-disulfide reductase [Pseudomonadota bacterium]|jgi:glutathione reductase (NADPH)
MKDSTAFQFDFDLFVIGAGSGGVRAARMAAAMGARVAIAEDRYMGGTCVNVGCVPKKIYVYASEYSKGFIDAARFGWQVGEISFDWATLRNNKKAEISRLSSIYERLLEAYGATIMEGRAEIHSANTVKVNDRYYSAERILLATGTWPYLPSIPGSEYLLTSNDIFDLEVFPERLLIVGGGYIATEFAGIFNGLGARVTQVYRGNLFLRGFDDDVRQFLATEVMKSGVDLRFNTNLLSVERNGNGYVVTMDDGSVVETDAVLCATGRRPNIDALNLEQTDVTLTEDGFIRVDDHFRTREPSIYALGDLIGGPQLTPVALAQGMAFARAQFGGQETAVDYDYIPTAVFSQPSVGAVGMTETQAKEKYGEIVVYKSEFKPMRHTISGRDERSLMKLVVDAASDRVVGLHMVGSDAGEICQGMAIAMRCGATKIDFDRTIGIHPTAAEEFVTMREPVSK